MNWINAESDTVKDIAIMHASMKLPSIKYLDASDHLHNVIFDPKKHLKV